ncbi:MAG: DUF4332 domain-containing protein [Bryobacteraceae bacterium]
MSYVFWHFLGCMLIAAAIGGIIGWLLRGFGFSSKFADLENEWRDKLGLAESERETLTGRLKESDGLAASWKQKFASLEADHGKLQADFSAGSGKIPALEAAVAGWTAKAATWDKDRAKLAADLDACGRMRSQLEAQVGEWSTRGKAWDTERSTLMAKLKAAADEDAVEDANYQKTIDHLRADIAGLQGKLAVAERSNKEWEGKVATVTADLKKAIADDVADDAEFKGKIDHLGVEIDGLKAKLVAAEASTKEWQAKHAAAEASASDWQAKHVTVSGQLQKALAADAADDEQFQKAIALLKSDIAGLQTKLSAAESSGRQWEGKASTAAAALTAAELASKDWEAKFQALDNEHSSLKAELVKFSQDDAFEDADFKRAIQNLRNKIAALESQLGSLQTERAKISAERDKLSADLKAAMTEDAVEDTKYQQTIAQLRNEIAALQGKAASASKDHEALVAERDKFSANLQAATAKTAAEDAKHQQTIAQLRAEISALQGKADSATKNHDALAAERDRLSADWQKKGASLESEISKLRAELKAANADREKLSLEVTNAAQHQETAAALRSEQATLASRLAAAETASTEWAARYAALESKASAPVAMAAAAGAGAGAATVTTIASDPNYHALARRFETFLVKTQKEGFGDIERIEGIGPVYGQKLRSIGIAWVRELLEQGGSATGRERIAEDSGIKRELILTWVNAADLLRVDGVTPDWAELLEESGVDTVKELRGRVPENLHRKMTETNAQGNFARSVPDVDTVRRWIEQAKKMEPKVTH